MPKATAFRLPPGLATCADEAGPAVDLPLIRCRKPNHAADAVRVASGRRPAAERLSHDSDAFSATDLQLSCAHALSATELQQLLAVDLTQGLSSHEARLRLRRFGPNRLSATRHRPLWLQLVAQFHAPLLYALLITGAVKAVMGSPREAGVIWSVTVINAVIGFAQEARAEQSIGALAQEIRSDLEVLRDGRRQRLVAEELVPGDVAMLAAGDRVHADLRLLEVRHLQLDESSLTGQSLPVLKGVRPDPPATPLADRTGMAHAGSFVSSGQGRGVVVATANATELGHLAASLKQGETLSTPLTRQFSHFSVTVLKVVLFVSIFTALAGLARGRSGAEMFDAAVALAVSAIPEELPAIVTITLAIGVHRMAQRNAIIRRLPAVEALGSATVICTDKTGTLTQNRMAVLELYAAGQRFRLEELWPNGSSPDAAAGDPLQRNRAVHELLLAGLLCSDARPSAHAGLVGDPTEIALLAAAQRAGLDHAEAHRHHPRRDALPFEPELQVMATLHGRERILVKGSLEAVLPRCRWQCASSGSREPLDHAALQTAADAMAAQGQRVLAFATGQAHPHQAALAHDHIETNLIFLGLQGMADPPRPEASRAVAACRAAGIAVKMVTGDHVGTATTIARQLGIGAAPEPRAIDGAGLATLPGDAVDAVVQQTDVFARMAPAQKLQLVRSLQASGQIVAMTGDGVNDAPALRQADIGIAMGAGGTAVAREAAAMVLTDDNFASITAAVEEGRGVALNLHRALAFCLPVNGGESFTILISALMGLELPITALQVLWLNMVNSLTMSLPLAFEARPAGLMRQPPLPPDRPLLSRPLLHRLAVVSAFSWVVIFAVFFWADAHYDDRAIARTMAVQALVLARVAYLISLSSVGPSRHGRWTRCGQAVSRAPALLIGLASALALQVLFSQWEPMHLFFGSASLTWRQWLQCSLVVLPMMPVAVVANRLDPLLGNGPAPPQRSIRPTGPADG
ncbi:MAG: HAD-IC family P-type ATPase [Cyanobacteria bacterium REEB417]|nr:HAD-IC family P-type ATPase [Cyanobacteria bacterium REEB417]